MSALNTVADYAAALRGLLPRGRVWPIDDTAVQSQVLAGLSPTAERLDEAAQDLLTDAFPASAVNLLPDWESSLGLAAGTLTEAQRQDAVVAALTAVGGQSKADFIAFAAALGAAIEISTYAPFRCGFNGCGDEIGGEDWCFAWSIAVTANTGALSNQALLAKIQAAAPAETVVFLT